MSIQVFCPFLIGSFIFLLLSCVSCLYILEIKPFSVALFANSFSRFVGRVFIFFNDTATTEIYTLSLHAALPIWATLHHGAWASHCRGLSCCGAQAPDAQAQ